MSVLQQDNESKRNDNQKGLTMARTTTQFQWFDQRDNQWHILPCGRVFDDPREAQEYFKKYGNHITRFLGGVRVRLFTTKELSYAK